MYTAVVEGEGASEYEGDCGCGSGVRGVLWKWPARKLVGEEHQQGR